MLGLKNLASRFALDARGSTAIEYGLIATLIAVGTLAGIQGLGGGVSGSWGNTATRVADAMK